MLPDNTLYRFYVDNLRAVEASINYTSQSTRKLISTKRSPKEISYFCRLYALSLGIWAEARLMKLLYERGGFTSDLRDKILNKDDLYLMWIESIKTGFRKKYGTNVPATARLRRSQIIQLMDEYLKPVITVRNRLAHGQWIYPLNEKRTNLAASIKVDLEKDNIMTLQFKMNLLSGIAGAIHDLVVSKPTFERDFDKHFRSVEQIKINLERRSYKKYTDNLVKKLSNRPS